MPNRIKKERRIATTEDAQPPVSELSILAAFRSGPLPPPAEMEKYEVLCPGATKMLFDNFIVQTNHRIELEKAVIQGDNKRADKAQRNSFIIILIILIMAGGLFFLGKDGYAIATIFLAISQIIIAFISSSRSRKQERESKRNQIGLK